MFERLAMEVEFGLESAVDRGPIKIHSITSRIKSRESVADKARRREINDPLAELDDLVGVRIVVLFLSDLPRLDALIRETFSIETSEDKIAGGDPATFGYMSKHYIATLGDAHSGPRYDEVKQMAFEIQTRTVVMDAWANVSHHLDYKGASSIPEDLKKDFFALSGLFYVADQHFEIFADRASESRQRAMDVVGQEPEEAVEVNLDTVEAFLRARYPDRKHSDRGSISDFVEEVTRADYDSINALERALTGADTKFRAYEERYPPNAVGSGDRFHDVGAARIALALADRSYAKITYHDVLDDPITQFASWGDGD
ncbi:MAG: hypothetical protein R2725_09730 [Solirubrobacterales bacterium]